MPNYVDELTTPAPVDIDKYIDLENVTISAKYPPKKPNWLLIGGIALAIILLFKKR